MKDSKKIIRSIIFFVILIALTGYVLLDGKDVFEIINIIKSADIKFVAIGIISMCVYLTLEGVNIGRTLKKLNEKSNFFRNIKYSLIGFFFSSITPAASGGQPMQIYYMYKDGISVSNSTLALLINLTSMQITTIGIALFSLIFNYDYLNKLLVICFLIGIFLNLSALTLLIIGIFSKRMSKWLINMALKVLKFFKVKDLDAKREKFENELQKYQTNAVYIKNNKLMMLKILLTTIIQFLVYYSITYWVYRALGFSGQNIFKIISMQAVLFATVSGIPSPGAVGVSEGAFIEIFKVIYSETLMSSAVLLNRGINFYLFVLISGIVVIVNQIRVNKLKKEKLDKTNDINVGV